MADPELVEEQSLTDLCNLATLHLGAIDAVAKQVGSESFGEWNEGIRDNYGQGMSLLVDDVIELVNQIQKSAK